MPENRKTESSLFVALIRFIGDKENPSYMWIRKSINNYKEMNISNRKIAVALDPNKDFRYILTFKQADGRVNAADPEQIINIRKGEISYMMLDYRY